MNYENMSIEELNAKEMELKVEYYDIDERKTKIKEELSLIENIKKEKSGEKEVTIEVADTPVEETKEEVSVLPEIEEAQEEVQAEVKEEPVKEATPEIENKIKVLSSMFGPVNAPAVEEQKEENVVLEPLIPQEENNVTEEVKSEDVVSPVPAVQNMEPLTPVGVDLPNTEEKPKAVVTELIKTDTNDSKAILLSTEQGLKTRKSKEVQKSIVLGEEQKAVVTPIESQPVPQVEVSQEVQAEAAPVVETPVQAESVSAEDKQKQLEAMVQNLANAKTEEEWNRINEKIAVLTKSLPQAA